MASLVRGFWARFASAGFGPAALHNDGAGSAPDDLLHSGRSGERAARSWQLMYQLTTFAGEQEQAQELEEQEAEKREPVHTPRRLGADAACESAGVSGGDQDGAAALATAPRRSPRVGGPPEPAAAAAAAAQPRVKLRTPEELSAARRDDFQLPLGCPAGPCDTDTALLLLVRSYANDVNTAGGSFNVTFAKGVEVGNSRRGPQHAICCSELVSGTKAHCGWGGKFEQTTEGWMWYSFHAHSGGDGRPAATAEGHSHPLKVTMAERLARAGTRSIPDDLKDDARAMAASGSSITAVFNFMKLKVTQRGETVAFVARDVRSLVSTTTGERYWDVTKFAETLQSRKVDLGLDYWIKLNAEGEMTCAFAVMAGGLEAYAVGGNDNVVIFDTKHGTNMHKYKLGCFVGISSTGATKIFAMSIVASEDTESFEWVFMCFLNAFRIEPRVLFTDSDAAMAAAFLLVFLTALHYLCIWHLSKNVLTNVPAALFKGDGHAAFMDGFWKICLHTDSSFAGDAFEMAWDSLLNPLRRGERSAARTAALDWLQFLYERRQKWAACYTWGTLTLTIHSSQRAEGLHSGIERWRKPNMLLTELLAHLDSFGAGINLRADTAEVLRCLRLLTQDQAGTLAPILASFMQIVTPFACMVVRAQWLQSLQYRVIPTATANEYLVERIAVPLPQLTASNAVENMGKDAYDGMGGSGPFSLQRRTSLQRCSCQWSDSVGLPCRHELAVASYEQVHDARMLVAVQHWKLVSDDERLLLVRRLLQAPPPARAGAAAAAVLPGALNRHDRFGLLMSAWRAVADQAALRPDVTEWALAEAQRVAGALRGAPLRAAGDGRADLGVVRGGRGWQGRRALGGGAAAAGAAATAAEPGGGAAGVDTVRVATMRRPAGAAGAALAPAAGPAAAPARAAAADAAARALNRGTTAAAAAVVPPARRQYVRRKPIFCAWGDEGDNLATCDRDLDGKMELCFECGQGGTLICCDTPACPRAYHAGCADLAAAPEDEWHC